MVKSKNNSKKKSYNGNRKVSKKKSKKNKRKKSKNSLENSTEEMQKIIDMPSTSNANANNNNKNMTGHGQFVYSPSQVDPMMINHSVPINTTNPNYKNLVQLGHDIGMQQIQTQMTQQAQMQQPMQMQQM